MRAVGGSRQRNERIPPTRAAPASCASWRWARVTAASRGEMTAKRARLDDGVCRRGRADLTVGDSALRSMQARPRNLRRCDERSQARTLGCSTRTRPRRCALASRHASRIPARRAGRRRAPIRELVDRDFASSRRRAQLAAAMARPGPRRDGRGGAGVHDEPGRPRRRASIAIRIGSAASYDHPRRLQAQGAVHVVRASRGMGLTESRGDNRSVRLPALG